jgi:hypothetical protein
LRSSILANTLAVLYYTYDPDYHVLCHGLLSEFIPGLFLPPVHSRELDETDCAYLTLSHRLITLFYRVVATDILRKRLKTSSLRSQRKRSLALVSFLQTWQHFVHCLTKSCARVCVAVHVWSMNTTWLPESARDLSVCQIDSSPQSTTTSF